MISLACLIYRSTRYADSVYGSLTENTPELQDGRAEFTFIANDADPDVVEHLSVRGYPFVDHRNDRRSEAELRDIGIAPPEYLHRVYRGWNRAIMYARGEYVLLVNSDHVFSPGWLAAISARADPGLAISCLTVEPGHPEIGHFGAGLNGTGSLRYDFGRHPDTFDRAGFEGCARAVAADTLTQGGVYMPCLFHRETAIAAGLYPEGNPIGDYGDRAFFRRMAELGVRHVTAHDSVVYHFQQGEMEEP